jgi:hypothetical protein
MYNILSTAIQKHIYKFLPKENARLYQKLFTLN